MKSSFAAVAALSFGSAAYAQYLVNNCPETNLCYSLNVPASTAQSGDGDIYFQITAPTTYSWAALGQGTGMSGANIFVMYTSANGQNVTVSPRLGTGHVMPLHDTAAQITLLEGSGVNNSIMTANVKCSNCQSWSGGTMDFTGSSANWIYAYKAGSPLDSDDVTETISKHDDGESFIWDITGAKGGNDANPFVSDAATPATTSGASSTSSTASATKTNSAVISEDSSSSLNGVIVAHGVLASIAFVALFPTGAILIRIANFTGLIWVHAAIQMIAYGFYIIAFGMGVYLATQLNLFDNHHPIVGIVLLVAVSIQPLSGLMHHKYFVKYGRRFGWSFEHLYVGRIAILIGIINGGNGLRLAGASVGQFTGYGICAAIMVIAYIAALFIGARRKKRNARIAAQRMPSPGLDAPVQLREQFKTEG